MYCLTVHSVACLKVTQCLAAFGGVTLRFDYVLGPLHALSSWAMVANVNKLLREGSSSCNYLIGLFSQLWLMSARLQVGGVRLSHWRDQV